MMAEDTDDRTALLRRAQNAIHAAVEALDEAKVVVAGSVLLREGRLTTRCAWCGRYHVAGRWVVVEDIPDFLAFAGATHGICEDCVTTLRADGRSA